MKHIKKFESFSINEEEEGIRKFFTGYDSSEEKEKAKANFMKSLEEAEAKVAESPEKYVFNKKALEKQAAENRYLGGIRIQKGGNDSSRMYVVYDKKVTGFEDLATIKKI